MDDDDDCPDCGSARTGAEEQLVIGIVLTVGSLLLLVAYGVYCYWKRWFCFGTPRMAPLRSMEDKADGGYGECRSGVQFSAVVECVNDHVSDLYGRAHAALLGDYVAGTISDGASDSTSRDFAFSGLPDTAPR